MPTKKSRPSSTLRTALNQVGAGQAAGNRETSMDVGVASSAVMAGTKNLQTQMSRIQAVQSGVDRRTTRGVTKLSDKARAIQRATIAQQNKVAEQYGMAGGAATLAFYGARARAGSGARVAEANVRQAVDQSKIGGMVAGIGAQGVAAGQAAAQYAIAQAEQSRFTQTADQAAAQAFALQQQVLANKLDLANFKAKQDILANAAGGSSDGVQIQAVASAGINAATGLRSTMNSYIDATGTLYNPSDVHWDGSQHYILAADGTKAPVHLPNALEAAKSYINENGIIDENQKAYVAAVSSALYQAGVGKSTAGPNQGAGPALGAATDAVIAQAIQQQTALLYPDYYKKHSKNLDAYFMAGITADTSTKAVQTKPPGEATPTAGGATGATTDLGRTLGRKDQLLARGMNVAQVQAQLLKEGFDPALVDQVL